MELLEALLVTVLLGLGTARMAAIVSIDKISEPLRDLIFHWHPPEDNDAKGWYYQSMRPATDEERLQMDAWNVPWWQKRWTMDDKLRKPTFIGQLVGCHKCVSVWIAAANILLYLVWQDAAIVWNTFMAISFTSSAVDSKWYK